MDEVERKRSKAPSVSTARSEGLTKLTPWAWASLDGMPKKKGGEQPRGTLKKLESRMKSWLTTITSEDRSKIWPSPGDQGRLESPKHRKEEVTMGPLGEGREDPIITQVTVQDQETGCGREEGLQRENTTCPLYKSPGEGKERRSVPPATEGIRPPAKLLMEQQRKWLKIIQIKFSSEVF